ncbi:glycosyltransferase [Gelria sp. Kuro-4]|uniref:glycosyltransferase n=1 Tax=Gelria sp. Kuro-4 TaxID=2796927 RepID=UPI001BEE893E|nr:glycosyltransferase [Gelria sp. Kuro-4]BCV25495.1 hypothetical protein kuro4_22680 [Gelria sp. Kuro-4]
MSQLSNYYGLVREEILACIPYWVTSVLDVGCGTGALGAAVKRRNSACFVAGVDIFPPALNEARQVLDKVWLGNVEELLKRGQIKSPDGGFDVIVCADVLEHLVDPWSTLNQLTALLSDRGQVVISLPNFRNIVELGFLLSGSWSYTEAGIFDRTHLRFFTLDSAREMIENAGLEVYSTRFVADSRVRIAQGTGHELYLPQEIELPGLKLPRKVPKEELDELTAYQILFIAGPRKGRRTLTEPQVSIIIPHYNRLELINRCLEAIRKNSGPASAYEIIVVDNGSSDGSREFLEKHQDVRCISNAGNMGFTLAANQGAAGARGKYLIFLNNDTEVQEGWLAALMAAASPENVGAVGARLIYPSGKLQEAGGIVFADGSGWNYGRGEDKDDPRFLYPRDVDYCSGAALLVKARAFWTVGGFDPQYAPAYYEDTDLCFSLRQHGWRVVYQPRAVVVHLEGATAGKSLDQGIKSYQAINQAKFRSKWNNELRQQYPMNRTFLERAAHRVPPLRILIVDQLPPLFDRASGSQRIFQVMQLLKKEGHAVCFFTFFEHGFQEYMKILQSTGVYVIASTGNAVTGNTVQTAIEAKARLAVLLSSYQPHVVWAEGYAIATAIADTVRSFAPHASLLTDTVDLHFLREQRMSDLEGGPKTDTKEKELAIYRQSDAVIAVTEKEKAILMQELPSKMISVVPNVHQPEPTLNSFHQRKGLLFVGNFRHPPNLDGIVWFLQNCWPTIVQQIPDISLYIVGDPVPNALREAVAGALRFGGHVQIMGHVPTLRPLLNSARLSIAPLRFGAGMKGKVAEALAAGLPVVTTPIGTEGMGLTDRVNVREAETPQAFAQAVVELYSNAAAWETLRKKGLEHVAQHYSPQAVTFRLRETLRPLVYGEGKPLAMFSLAEDTRKQPLVSVVIPCWNNVEYTRRCVDSVFRNTEEPFELILIDNGSTDGTASYFASLQKQHTNVVVISNKLNTGFAYACNQGLAAAAGDYVVILNNDIVLSPNWLRLLLRPAQAAQVGIVGPRANNVSGSQCTAASYGNNLSLMEGFARALARKNAYQGSFAIRAIGFCMLVKRAVIEAIGGFDPRFGIGNFEDDDFCVRAQLAGYKIWIADDAFVHHFGSVSFRNGGIDYAKLMRRNFELLKAKWQVAPETKIEDGIPYGEMLCQGFSKDWHYCPLTPRQLAEENDAPVPLLDKRSYHFLIIPDWERPGERWTEAVKAFYEAFAARADVGLLIRIDPLLWPDVGSILERLQTWATREGIDLEEEGRLLLVVNDVVPPRAGAAVYRTAHAFIDTAPAGVFNRYAEEAQACGLTLCHPAVQELQNALTGTEGKQEGGL